ncbi:hypothetical protein Metev_0370 [Methanohalobium evestigatum Z-7303]|uniref:Uncharacterized protein n=1 Tax=Methanohalobium evestigatum (strain ATCC BAA-1072 / DSM 3721 / NBRC 107634 / OCM 161 / Z-7303) TaxID=644295 RepID=D7E6S0_METEZ|nr:hypothetical protein Metev_0370 [Methanohalobium evestigatum Z-7303]
MGFNIYSKVLEDFSKKNTIISITIILALLIVILDIIVDFTDPEASLTVFFYSPYI